jgi:hypothetical protein
MGSRPSIGSILVTDGVMLRSSVTRVPAISSQVVVGESVPASVSSPSHSVADPLPLPDETVGWLPWSSAITGAVAPHGKDPPLPNMRPRPPRVDGASERQ